MVFQLAVWETRVVLSVITLGKLQTLGHGPVVRKLSMYHPASKKFKQPEGCGLPTQTQALAIRGNNRKGRTKNHRSSASEL